MNTTIANRIYIENPSDEVKAWAKENLMFPNPVYEKKIRMGFWVGNTRKTIRMYEWNGNVLILPFGVIRQLMPMLRGTGVMCDFRQNTVIDYGSKSMDLFDYQQEAVRNMIDARYGILKAPCGAGKTRCGISLIKALRRRALWLCNKHDLIKQSMEAAEEFIDPSLFGTITEGRIDVGTGVTFATVQTMSQIELTQFRDYWDVIIIDECHGVATSDDSFTMYEKVLNHLSARSKIGLTATPYRSDGLIKATFALIGNVAYEIPPEAVQSRVTGVKIRPVPTETEITDECQNPDGTINYTKLLKHIVTDGTRNKLIASKIIDEKDQSCVILSDRLDQLKEIIALLPDDMQDKVGYIDGKMQSKKAKADRSQIQEDMRAGTKMYLFGSYKIAREGLDIPRLSRLFMASPVKDPSIVEQSVGRIRRVHESKTEIPVVYDFVDENIGMCCGMFKRRKTTYRKVGAEIEKPSDESYTSP